MTTNNWIGQENIAKIKENVRSYCQLSIQMIADMVHIDEETVTNFIQPIEQEQNLYQNGPQKPQSGAERHPESYLQ